MVMMITSCRLQRIRQLARNVCGVDHENGKQITSHPPPHPILVNNIVVTLQAGAAFWYGDRGEGAGGSGVLSRNREFVPVRYMK